MNMSIPIPTTEIIVGVAYIGMLGLLGQLARGVIGLYKARLKLGSKWIVDWKFFAISLGSGAIIGILAGTLLGTSSPTILIPIGYGGVDVLEGLLDSKLKDTGLKKDTNK